jgi:hypothetical protein
LALLVNGTLVGSRVPFLLVEDSVESDGSLAGLTISDNQFTLATTDGNHGVDTLDSSLHGLVDGLTGNNTRSLDLDTLALDVGEWSLELVCLFWVYWFDLKNLKESYLLPLWQVRLCISPSLDSCLRQFQIFHPYCLPQQLQNTYLPINRVTEGINNTPEKPKTNGNIDNRPSSLDDIALLNEPIVSEHDDTDVIGLEVEGLSLS